MKPIRFRIRRLMTWVAVVAINLAVLRALFASRRIDILGGGALLWVALEIGAFRALRNRGLARAYWLGFVGCGTVAALSLPAAVRFPASIPGRAWMGYFGATEGLFERLAALVARNIGNAAAEITIVFLMAAWEFFPMVLAAWAGGLLARRILESSGRRPGLADGSLAP